MVKSGGGCSAIKGVFDVSGKSSDREANYPITLNGAIFHLPHTAAGAGIAVMESNPSSTSLEIQFFKSTIGNVTPLSVLKLNVDCQNGWLVVDRSGSGYADGTYSESEGALFFALSETGDLLVRSVFQVERKSVLIFRSSKNGDFWYSFPRAQ